MEIIHTIKALKTFLQTFQNEKKKVALVPTMGALHKGHLSLIKMAQQQADVVVCSIFVNPTQFTDPKDLEKYPRPLVHDIKLLQEVGCNVVFMPSVKEMYPAPENWQINLGPAEFLLEGEFRKGHYQGVTQIVKKLFDAVNPDVAFFGQKDFQQVLMIKNMINHFNLPVKLVSCAIIREEDGLAMSSRNIRLNDQERIIASLIPKIMLKASIIVKTQGINESKQFVEEITSKITDMKLDYFEVCESSSLVILDFYEKTTPTILLIALFVGKTRLIDNLVIE